MTIPILVKIDFKSQTVTREKEEHCILIKGQFTKNVIIMNKYAPNIRILKYVKQTLTKLRGKIISCTIIAEGMNVTISVMDITSGQKIK